VVLHVALTVDVHTDCQCLTDVINCQQHLQYHIHSSTSSVTLKAFVDVYLNCVNVKGRQKGSWTGRLVGQIPGMGMEGRKKRELKGITIHTMKVERGSRGTAALILNLDTR